MKRFLMAALCVAATAMAVEAASKPKGDKGKKAAPAIDTDKAFATLDENKDGQISRDEFNKITTVMTLQGKKAGTKVEAMFKKLDTNGDGYLSADEFKKVGSVKAKGEKKKKVSAFVGDKKKKDKKGDKKKKKGKKKHKKNKK